MAYNDPKAKKEVRYRINLNHYQADAVEALARLHRKQTASYLHEIVLAHLASFEMSEEEEIVRNPTITRCA
ncbi:hypothetical protein A3765_10590 [Oleiphilus sp. HI0130]|nr:hypothetical protein A3765_18470 [Oleiphilus sp. HI0130]KZZ75260.1 hypothetical protein A3765_10590 [Oleiphilus sp. HI0130]